MAFASIDHESDIPVWIQLYNILLAGIHDGTWAPHTRLPSARTIQEESGLARETTKKAFNRLRDEGLVKMVPGRGPFVVGPGSRAR
ncbi:MAG: winged helix-turn-helix transcriptional regulator [Streptosporangiaceae bacterium]|nr:winged helix-turn-helix transcriptional regulator [Streptosporangiaceae bacterium]MBV9858118.1 winged helix-turn-helix transcriptional regulator [Streptosporangiaceae bacterium]